MILDRGVLRILMSDEMGDREKWPISAIDSARKCAYYSVKVLSESRSGCRPIKPPLISCRRQLK
jgi:hypothetical protein